MAYPLIILGAGASMDYLRADDHIERRIASYSKYRAPLMNQLFDDSRFHDILARHPKIDSFATDVMNAMSRPIPSFEDYLTNARDNLAKGNPAIYSQLISLTFYLSDLFCVISDKFYYQRNHYKDILHKIDNYFSGQACFVNFNYDLLLERSLNEHSGGKYNYSNISSYVSTGVKIIKIHGACNWRYNPQTVQSKETTAVDFFTQFSEKLLMNTHKNKIYPSAVDIANVNFNPEYSESLKSWTVKLPALALPLKDKPSNYVCDEAHINTLKECIKKVDRMLIIGWGGADQFLLSLLKGEIGDRRVDVVVVTKNTTPDSVIKYYGDNVPQLKIDPKNVYQGGFSEFMKTEGYENFFIDNNMRDKPLLV